MEEVEMSATYLAVARSVQGLRGALAQWAETRLAGASLGGMEAAGVELRVVRLEAGRFSD